MFEKLRVQLAQRIAPKAAPPSSPAGGSLLIFGPGDKSAELRAYKYGKNAKEGYSEAWAV